MQTTPLHLSHDLWHAGHVLVLQTLHIPPVGFINEPQMGQDIFNNLRRVQAKCAYRIFANLYFRSKTLIVNPAVLRCFFESIRAVFTCHFSSLYRSGVFFINIFA